MQNQAQGFLKNFKLILDHVNSRIVTAFVIESDFRLSVA